MRWFAPLLLIASLAGAAGCSGVSDPSDNTNEFFSGVLEPNSGDVYEFDVNANNGEYSVRITKLSPTPSALFIVFLGQVVNAACQPYLNQINPTASLNRDALGPYPISRGHYCVQVYDQGRLTEPQTYTIRVSHP